MSPLAWSAVLMMVGLALVVVEVFVPSGGILGFVSVSALLASIGLAFYQGGLEAGLVFLSVAAVAVPVALAIAFRWWPHTPLGKRVLLSIPTEEEVMPDTPLLRTLRQLVGKQGVAKTLMLPSGAVSIGDLTVDALSEGMPIEPGQRVRVIEVRGNRVVVRPVDATEDPAASDDILSRPIEAFGLESFEEPPA